MGSGLGLSLATVEGRGLFISHPVLPVLLLRDHEVSQKVKPTKESRAAGGEQTSSSSDFGTLDLAAMNLA